MRSAEHWPAGASVAWRSVRDGDVRTVIPMRVVADDADRTLLYVGPGATYKRRRGVRGGPGGRMLLERHEGHEDVAWRTNRRLVIHRWGDAHSVLLHWDDASGAFLGWYVNLEVPWRRTSIGFDTWDALLDIEIAPDRSTWRWKDEAELAWAVADGRIRPDEAAAARSAGERVLGRLARGDPPFSEPWDRWAPDRTWPPPDLPARWDAPPG